MRWGLPWLALTACPAPTPTSPTRAPTVRLETLSRPTCANPDARQASPFASVLLPNATPATETYLWGAGIVAADFDNDGLDEILTIRDGLVEYVTWADGAWVDRAGLPSLPLDYAFGAAAADIDADGDLDVLITRWGAPNHLLLNDGTGTFTRQAQAAGPETHHSASPTFVDIDGDGDLDLFIAGHGFVDEEGADPAVFEPADPSLVYLNEGGQFTLDTTMIPHSTDRGYTFIGAFVDLDGDVDPDLILVNDFGRRYHAGQLLWNENGTFVPDNNAVGLDLPVAGMGIAVGELNGDGVPDILVPYWGGYSFMLSGEESWFDWSQAASLSPATAENQVIGWGANFGDLDNDGTLDAVVMHGFLETDISPAQPSQPDGVFRGLGGTFNNLSGPWAGRDTADSRGLVVADFNGDGWLDYARPDLNGPTRILMGNCGQQAFLNIDLRQEGPNPFAVGATLTAIAGQTRQWRRIVAGGEGYGSGGPPEAHFGWGAIERVDLEIRWPDGTVDTVADVPTGQNLRIHRMP